MSFWCLHEWERQSCLIYVSESCFWTSFCKWITNVALGGGATAVKSMNNTWSTATEFMRECGSGLFIPMWSLVGPLVPSASMWISFTQGFKMPFRSRHGKIALMRKLRSRLWRKSCSANSKQLFCRGLATFWIHGFMCFDLGTYCLGDNGGLLVTGYFRPSLRPNNVLCFFFGGGGTNLVLLALGATLRCEWVVSLLSVVNVAVQLHVR